MQKPPVNKNKPGPPEPPKPPVGRWDNYGCTCYSSGYDPDCYRHGDETAPLTRLAVDSSPS